MAATAISLHLRTTRPTLLRRFSTSKPPPEPNSEPKQPSEPKPQTSFSSYFNEVKASLSQKPPPPPSPPPSRLSFQYRFSPATQTASHDEIRKNLSEFRLRSAAPRENLSPSPATPFSLQNLYQRNVTKKEGDSANLKNKGGSIDLKAISESLRQFKANNPNTNQDMLSLKRMKESFTLRPSDPRPFVMGSPRKFPELKEKNDGDNSRAMKTEFVKMYNYKELGEKLRELRPEGKPDAGFSLQELNERLIKLRENEERETATKIGNVVFGDLRQSLYMMQTTKREEKPKTVQKLDFLNHLGQTPSYMQQPPKEHLVEKYFHPDNMSSAEKLKIELQKVRDEFKMSESDCGSARVQVAQLTTKIKHLTTTLHKKDTHSRKGLQGMIQQRKKLLKYLRRTDWDSYTLVLSKFGLRDNPDHKRLPTKEKKMKKA